MLCHKKAFYPELAVHHLASGPLPLPALYLDLHWHKLTPEGLTSSSDCHPSTLPFTYVRALTSAFPSSLEEGDAMLRNRKRRALGAGHALLVTVLVTACPSPQLRTEAQLKFLSGGGLWSHVRLEIPALSWPTDPPRKVLATALRWLAALTRCNSSTSLLSPEAPVQDRQ